MPKVVFRAERLSGCLAGAERFRIRRPCMHNSLILRRFPGLILSRDHWFFQPTTICRYFERACLPFKVTRTARDFTDGAIQPSSRNRLYRMTPNVPARCGRRSVQSGHWRASLESAVPEEIGTAIPRCSNHSLPRSVTVKALPAAGIKYPSRRRLSAIATPSHPARCA